MGHHVPAASGAWQYFYLYLIEDIYSCKAVGWEVYQQKSGELAAGLLQHGQWSANESGDHAAKDVPFVIGRKNWLFSDTPKGATASAQLYSVVETAKANGQEPCVAAPRTGTTAAGVLG